MSAAIINKFMDMIGMGNKDDEYYDEEAYDNDAEGQYEDDEEEEYNKKNQYNKDKICLICIFCLYIYKQLKYFYYALNILFRAFLMKTIDNRKKD